MNKVGSVSCPFPFSDQPGVPLREQYISPGVLKTLSSRKSKTVKAPGASLPPLNPVGGLVVQTNNFSNAQGPPEGSFQPIGHPVGAVTKPSRHGSVWGGQASVGGFDRTDIGMLVEHLIKLSDPISIVTGAGGSASPTGIVTPNVEKDSDVVTMAAFDGVLKKFAAHKGAAKAEEHARRALCTFELFLQFRNKSLFTWFKNIDTVGTGSISHFKFQHSLKELAFEVKQPLVWSEAEIQDLTDYVCNGTNADITLFDIEHAFERMHHHNANAGDEAVIGSLLAFLRGIMKRERIRVIDLFHHVDEHGQGYVTRDQMTAGLKALILHPHDLTPKHHMESTAAMYYQGNKRAGERLRPVVPLASGRGMLKGENRSAHGFALDNDDDDSSKVTGGMSTSSSLKKGIKCHKKREEEEFVKLMRESQQYLDAKVDAFNKKDVNYQHQVKQGVKKYISTSVRGYDRHIDTDLNRLLRL